MPTISWLLYAEDFVFPDVARMEAIGRPSSLIVRYGYELEALAKGKGWPLIGDKDPTPRLGIKLVSARAQ
jgi:hypothetical protein